MRYSLLFAVCLWVCCVAAATKTESHQDEGWRSLEAHRFGGDALHGMVRCHKCLFADHNVSNSEVGLMLRAADSHQRYLAPLELNTAGGNLPGREIAHTIFLKNTDALNFAKAAVKSHFFENPKKASVETELSETEMQDLISNDLDRYQRILQYAVAANCSSFIRPDAWKYYVSMYREKGVDIDAVRHGVEKLQSFYDPQHVKSDVWRDIAKPHFNTLLDHLGDIDRRQSRSSATPQKTAVLEAEPEFRSDLLVDPRNLTSEDLAGLSPDQRQALEGVFRRWGSSLAPRSKGSSVVWID